MNACNTDTRSRLHGMAWHACFFSCSLLVLVFMYTRSTALTYSHASLCAKELSTIWKACSGLSG